MSAKGLPTEQAERRLVPPFTAEHEELRASLRRFVEGELRPHAEEWERERWVPNEMFVRMGELGFFGLDYPEEYGGQGGDCLHSAVLAEEMARCGSGGDSSRTSASTINPSVPSEPMNTASKSSPGASKPSLPSSTTSPSIVTIRTRSTLCTVRPYFKQCTPPEFSATLPPIEQAICDEGSGA